MLKAALWPEFWTHPQLGRAPRPTIGDPRVAGGRLALESFELPSRIPARCDQWGAMLIVTLLIDLEINAELRRIHSRKRIAALVYVLSIRARAARLPSRVT